MTDGRPTAHGGAAPPLVRLSGIAKRFGDTVANEAVDLDVKGGEIHALLGENGAGKSTLVKILYGLLQPDAGTIAWRGSPVAISGPEAARRLGIGMVFQHFSLFDALSVAENIALAMPGATGASIGPRATQVAARLGLELDLRRAVWTLSAGERQRIEIVRCLLSDPALIVLDEPTSVLTPPEVETLFATLTRLQGEGRGILLITHKLDEVRRLCDRATILRAGRVVARLDPRESSPRAIAGLMVGAEIGEVAREPARNGPVLLRVERASLPASSLHGTRLQGLDLTVHAGEIVGVAGVAGNGQSELFALLSGEALAPEAGMVQLMGEAVGREGIAARRRLGAAFVPEERLGHAAVPAMTLSENALVSRHGSGGLVSFGMVAGGAVRRLARTIARAFDVRHGGGDPPARTLSGGNLQKYVVGREVLREPRLLAVDQPTWGVDAGAAAAIRTALVALSRRGAALLVVSQDLDELFEIADRIAVIRAGRLTPARPASELTREAVGLAMAGEGEGSETPHPASVARAA